MSANELKDLGNKHLQAGEFDAAIDAYTKAIAIDPNNHVFYSNRSAAYLSKHDAENALKDGESCIRVNKEWPKGYSRKGAALHALKRYDEAISTYEAGLAVAPTDAGLKSGLAEVKKAKENDAQAGAGAGGAGGFMGQLIMKLASHPKYGPKLSDPVFMNKLSMIKTNPNLLMTDPELMEVFTALFAPGADAEENVPQQPQPTPQPAKETKATPPPKEEEPEEDLTEEELTLRKKKKDSVAAKERGNAFYKEKKFAEALAAYDEAIALDETNMMFLNNKAAVYIEMGEIDTAIQTCLAAIEVGKVHRATYEDRAKVYHRIAAAELKRNNIAAAIKAYSQAQMEHFDKAIERKMKNLELDLKKQERENYINPELATEAKERGNAAFRDGNFPKAIEEYEEAVKRDPKNPAYRNNLSAAYLKMGLFNDAKKEIEKCIELDRNYVKAWAKKGDIEFFMKEYHKSMDSYRAGLQIEPDNALCKQGLAKVMEKINSSEDDPERAAHAMADPEIQTILNDPVMRNVLNDMQQDPKSANKALNDPIIRANIEKLVAAGILKIR